MRPADAGPTRTSELRALRDWNDQQAWVEFHGRYDPLLRSYCRSLRLDEQTSDEIRQLTWIEVAKRMRSFVYDPQKSFRGWLRTVCKNKALDYVQKQGNDPVLPIEERDEARRSDRARSSGGLDLDSDRDWDEDPVLSLWKRRAEEVQAAVKARVQPHTWEAFWLLFVRDWGLEETVEALGITHASAYKAKERVIRRLRDEGRRRYGSEFQSGS